MLGDADSSEETLFALPLQDGSENSVLLYC